MDGIEYDPEMGQYVAQTATGNEVFGNTWSDCLTHLTEANRVAAEHDAKAEEPRTRQDKAQELLAAGAVSKDGRAHRFYVRSQSGDGRYVVDTAAGTCQCADFQHGHNVCKHLLAARQYEAQQQTARIVIETTGYARGRQVLDQELARVRVGDCPYRDPKNRDYNAVLAWLRAEGYELVQTVRPRRVAGTVTVRYLFAKAEPKPEPSDGAQVIKTSGGSVTVEGGAVTSAWCSNCKHSRRPSRISGRWVCACGATIARADELDTRDTALPVQRRRGKSVLFKS